MRTQYLQSGSDQNNQIQSEWSTNPSHSWFDYSEEGKFLTSLNFLLWLIMCNLYLKLNQTSIYITFIQIMCEHTHTSEMARRIFQSSRAIPGGVTATLVCCARPSVFMYVPFFSVYAAPGRMMSAMGAPTSPWWPALKVRERELMVVGHWLPWECN